MSDERRKNTILPYSSVGHRSLWFSHINLPCLVAFSFSPLATNFIMHLIKQADAVAARAIQHACVCLFICRYISCCLVQLLLGYRNECMCGLSANVTNCSRASSHIFHVSFIHLTSTITQKKKRAKKWTLHARQVSWSSQTDVAERRGKKVAAMKIIWWWQKTNAEYKLKEIIW